MFASKALLVSDTTTRLGPPGTEDSGLCTPANESILTRAWVLSRNPNVNSDQPSLADVFINGKIYLPGSEQIQYQQSGDTWHADWAWGCVPPIAPPEGETAPVGSILIKVTPKVDQDAQPAPGYNFDESVFGFSVTEWVQPAVEEVDTMTIITPGSSPASFAVDDIAYFELGCLLKVTAVDGNTLTLKNINKAAAAVSVGA